MSRRKGELSKGTIDREWPHQVALRSDECTGHNFRTIHYFVECEKLSHCSRGHHFYRDGICFNVHCFAEREHAERFRVRFNGKRIFDAIADVDDEWSTKPRRREKAGAKAAIGSIWHRLGWMLLGQDESERRSRVRKRGGA